MVKKSYNVEPVKKVELQLLWGIMYYTLFLRKGMLVK
jgi:hypothetical protein